MLSQFQILILWEPSTLMGPSGPRSELIFLDGMVYEGWIINVLVVCAKGHFDNYVRLHKDK